MSAVPDAIVAVAAVVTALTIVLGGISWLVWPRFEAKLQEVARSVDAVGQQVDQQLGTTPGTAGAAARTAAQRTAELSEQLTAQGEVLREFQTWRADTDRRITGLEGALIALLGQELRGRLVEVSEQTHHHHIHREDTPEP